MEGNSKEVGDETEAMILHDLIANGYTVSLPFGANDGYDLVVDDGATLHRVQCKTAWTTREGTMRFNTHSQTTRDGDYHERTYDGEIDAFLVRYPATERLYWIDIEDATSQKMDLGPRLLSTIHRSTGLPNTNSTALFRKLPRDFFRDAACHAVQ